MSTTEAVVTQDQGAAPESVVVDETKQPDAPGERESTEGEKQPEAEKKSETEQAAKKPRPWFRDVIDAKDEQIANLRRQNEEIERQIRESQTPEQREQRQQQSSKDDVIAQARRQWEMEQKVSSWDQAGCRDFPDFRERCQELARMGGHQRDFVELIVGMEDGHTVAARLAENPEEAVRILHLPPSRMAMELGRMSAKGLEPVKPPQSAAPPPIKPLGGNGRADGDANLTDDQWYAKWQAERGQKG